MIELALDGEIAEMGRDLDEINIEIAARDTLVRSERDEIASHAAEVVSRDEEMPSRTDVEGHGLRRHRSNHNSNHSSNHNSRQGACKDHRPSNYPRQQNPERHRGRSDRQRAR